MSTHTTTILVLLMREAFNLFIVFIVGFMVYLYGLTLAWNLGYTAYDRQSATFSLASGLPGRPPVMPSGIRPTGSARCCS